MNIVNKISKPEVVRVALQPFHYHTERNFSGFLTTGTPEIPGNAGMMDQVMALKWVQENIRYCTIFPPIFLTFQRISIILPYAALEFPRI